MRPRILLLDEPSAGLDPVGTAEVVKMINQLRDDGIAVVGCTHDVDLAYQVAQKVAIVVEGAVEVGDPDAMLMNHDLMTRAHLNSPWAPLVSRIVGHKIHSLNDLQALLD